MTGITESNGFGLLRFDQDKKKLMSHSEALGYREQCLKFRVPRGVEHLLEQPRIESFHSMLDASIILGQLLDVRISEGDQFLLYMRNLPNKVQSFFQLHQNAIRVQQILTGVQDYYTRPRVQRDIGSVHMTQPVQKPGDVGDKTCFNRRKNGPSADTCPERKECSHCGKKKHVAKECWEKHPDTNQAPWLNLCWSAKSSKWEAISARRGCHRWTKETNEKSRTSTENNKTSHHKQTKAVCFDLKSLHVVILHAIHCSDVSHIHICTSILRRVSYVWFQSTSLELISVLSSLPPFRTMLHKCIHIRMSFCFLTRQSLWKALEVEDNAVSYLPGNAGKKNQPFLDGSG